MQVTTGDPSAKSAWQTHGLFFGVRTVGLRGVMGAWSDPAQIRVL
ncbi:MAG: hypothetical protein ABL974_12870 [Prosthecobacter sp.]